MRRPKSIEIAAWIAAACLATITTFTILLYLHTSAHQQRMEAFACHQSGLLLGADIEIGDTNDPRFEGTARFNQMCHERYGTLLP